MLYYEIYDLFIFTIMNFLTDEVKKLLYDKMLTLLQSGSSSQTVKTTRHVKIKRDANDEIIERESNYKEEKTTRLNDCPNFVLQFLMQQLNTEQAIKHLSGLGFVILDPTIKQEVGNEKQGLTQETIDKIYSNFLGVDVEKIQELEINE
jgi:hypothetical protein